MTRIAYSIREAAAALGISESSVKTLIGSGRLKTVRLGRRVLIKAAELERLLADA